MRTLCSLSPDELTLLKVCLENRLGERREFAGEAELSELSSLLFKISMIRDDLQDEYECEVITSDSEERGQDLDDDDQFLYDNTPDDDGCDQPDPDETIF